MNNPGSPAAMHWVAFHLESDAFCTSIEQRDPPAPAAVKLRRYSDQESAAYSPLRAATA
jgi:hypothetical protein